MDPTIPMEIADQVILPAVGNLSAIHHPAEDLEHLQVLLVVGTSKEAADAQNDLPFLAGRRGDEGRGIHRWREHLTRVVPALRHPGAGELGDRQKQIVAGGNLTVVAVHPATYALDDIL